MTDKSSKQESGALPEHVEKFAPQLSHLTLFDRLICELIGCKLGARHDGRRKAMVAALDNQVPYSRIRDWRRGKCGTPKWALDLIEVKLAARAEHVAALRELRTQVKPGRGQDWPR